MKLLSGAAGARCCDRAVSLARLRAGAGRRVEVRSQRRLRARHPPRCIVPTLECPGAMVINQGPVVEMKTRRTYFLDYPCDLKQGEKVTFILSLHGGGSYGNWQRHYFPLLDYKDKYRLVIATPNSPTRVVVGRRRSYLQNIVTFVVEQIGKEQHQGVLAGRPLAGWNDVEPDRAHRLLQDTRRRLAEPVRRSTRRQSRPRRTLAIVGASAARGRPRRRRSGARARPAPHGRAAARAADERLLAHLSRQASARSTTRASPTSSTGRRSTAAASRGAAQDIVDTPAGYVYDCEPPESDAPGWGLLPAPGKAQVVRVSRAARTVGSSPMSCGSTRGTPKAWSRRSPRSSSS